MFASGSVMFENRADITTYSIFSWLYKNTTAHNVTPGNNWPTDFVNEFYSDINLQKIISL